MTDKNLDPASLTAEERAIVDHEALRFHRDWAGEARYKAALGICEPIILARRALFAPTKEEAKVLPCGCVRCTCENETQCQGCGAKNCAEHRASRTAPPSEMPPQDEVKAVAHNVRECGSDEAAALILALSLVKWRSQPAPAPPSEMPIEISHAVHKMRLQADDDQRRGHTTTPKHWRENADALEFWWRSQQTEFAQLEDKIISLATELEALRSQPVRLEKVRRALKCGQERLNIVFLSEETTTRWNNLFYEALAELDAAEGKVTG